MPSVRASAIVGLSRTPCRPPCRGRGRWPGVCSMNRLATSKSGRCRPWPSWSVEPVEEPADDVIGVREVMVGRGQRGDLRAGGPAGGLPGRAEVGQRPAAPAAPRNSRRVGDRSSSSPPRCRISGPRARSGLVDRPPGPHGRGQRPAAPRARRGAGRRGRGGRRSAGRRRSGRRRRIPGRGGRPPASISRGATKSRLSCWPG